jgi:hypothetical protein
MIAHQSVADILRDHVRLSVEGIDRMYLNVYVPQLQSEQGVVRFFKYHRGQPLPSAALMAPISRGFVAQLERFVTEHGIALVQFRKGERKDAVMAELVILSRKGRHAQRCCCHSLMCGRLSQPKACSPGPCCVRWLSRAIASSVAGMCPAGIHHITKCGVCMRSNQLPFFW